MMVESWEEEKDKIKNGTLAQVRRKEYNAVVDYVGPELLSGYLEVTANRLMRLFNKL